MAAIQMVDVELPTTDGRIFTLSLYTEPEPGQKLLIQYLKRKARSGRKQANWS
jgi:hypothetical protein